MTQIFKIKYLKIKYGNLFLIFVDAFLTVDLQISYSLRKNGKIPFFILEKMEVKNSLENEF